MCIVTAVNISGKVSHHAPETIPIPIAAPRTMPSAADVIATARCSDDRGRRAVREAKRAISHDPVATIAPRLMLLANQRHDGENASGAK